MSQIELVQPNHSEENTAVRARVKHCRSCWRDDYHHEIKMPPFLYGFLLIITLGTIFFVRPSRCVCCGTKRVF